MPGSNTSGATVPTDPMRRSCVIPSPAAIVVLSSRYVRHGSRGSGLRPCCANPALTTNLPPESVTHLLPSHQPVGFDKVRRPVTPASSPTIDRIVEVVEHRASSPDRRGEPQPDRVRAVAARSFSGSFVSEINYLTRRQMES